MKITRRQLRKIILEATRDFKVKTVSDDEYLKNISTLPEPMQDIASGQRPSAVLKKDKYMVGSFFMTKGVPYKPPSGYGALKRFFDFYMILPDGDSILVNPSSFIIEKEKDGIRFLNLLNQNVSVLPLDSLENANIMRAQVRKAITMMGEK